MLFDRKQKFKTLIISLNVSKDGNYLFDQISSNLGLVEDLRVESDANPHFRPVFTSWPQRINISSADWFTLESLLTCSCTTIRLEKFHLGNKDLDVLLRKWKTGGFPNLEFLNFHGHNFTKNEEHILGMNLEELDWKVIRTDDGSKKAIIRKYPYREIDISVTPF